MKLQMCDKCEVELSSTHGSWSKVGTVHVLVLHRPVDLCQGCFDELTRITAKWMDEDGMDESK